MPNLGCYRSVLAAAAVLASILASIVTPVAPARAAAEPHLPSVVHAPGTWSDEEWVEGPVAALGIATRNEIGIEDVLSSRELLHVFAVSALDGSAAWIDLPGFSLDRSGYSGSFAVSPDGQWIGWVRSQRGRPGNMRVGGWSVMNALTGEVRRLEDPVHGSVRGTTADLGFSGDSRYLLTSYEPPIQPAVPNRGHQFVAWDVRDGTSSVLEEPGKYWLPNLGSAPDGVVWARGRQVFRQDPATGDRTTVSLPRNVVTASWAPDDAGFAYLGRPSVRSSGPWRLYAGRTVEQARDRALELPSEMNPSQLLGWRDETHVVVGHHRRQVHVVDIVSGVVERIDLAGYGDPVNAPYLAGDLWQRPLETPVEPKGTTDPRKPWQWASGALLVLLAAGLVLHWRRGRRRRSMTAVPPGQPLGVLARAATGLIIVFVDLRIAGVDLVPDPIGWALAAAALSSLRPVHPGFQVAGVAAGLAVVPSLPDWWGVQSILIDVAIPLATLVMVVGSCTGIVAARPDRAWSASTIRALSLGLGAALAVGLTVATAEPSIGILVLTIGLANFGVALWFLVLLYRVARQGPGAPPRRSVPSTPSPVGA